MENNFNHVAVSIIMPSYRSEVFLPMALDSVLSQTFKEWELIVVDDCSPDYSNKIIKEYMKRSSKIKLIQLENNSGPAVARNRAIEAARGRYIAFLDSDDLWHHKKLEKQIDFMQSHNIALSYTSYYKIGEESGGIIGEVKAIRRVNYGELLKQNVIGCSTAIYDAEKLGKTYMPNILKRQDFALWLKILKKISYAYGLDESLTHYRVRSTSVSSNKVFAAKYTWKLYREVEKLPIYKAIYYFIWYACKSILKYKKLG